MRDEPMRFRISRLNHSAILPSLFKINKTIKSKFEISCFFLLTKKIFSEKNSVIENYLLLANDEDH